MFIRSATAALHNVSDLKFAGRQMGLRTQLNLFHLLPGYIIFWRLSVTLKKKNRFSAEMKP